MIPAHGPGVVHPHSRRPPRPLQRGRGPAPGAAVAPATGLAARGGRGRAGGARGQRGQGPALGDRDRVHVTLRRREVSLGGHLQPRGLVALGGGHAERVGGAGGAEAPAEAAAAVTGPVQGEGVRALVVTDLRGHLAPVRARPRHREAVCLRLGEAGQGAGGGHPALGHGAAPPHSLLPRRDPRPRLGQRQQVQRVRQARH